MKERTRAAVDWAFRRDSSGNGRECPSSVRATGVSRSAGDSFNAEPAATVTPGSANRLVDRNIGRAYPTRQVLRVDAGTWPGVRRVHLRTLVD